MFNAGQQPSAPPCRCASFGASSEPRRRPCPVGRVRERARRPGNFGAGIRPMHGSALDPSGKPRRGRGAVPGVMQHNDLGTWDIVSDGHGGFGVIDWESSRPVGLPLWDLLSFLVDAHTCRAGRQPVDRLAEALALLRGDHPDFSSLFGHVRRQVATLDFAPSGVGALVTFGWPDHGLSAARRVQSLDEQTVGNPAATTSLQAPLAPAWLNDPALGAGWSAWR